MRKNACLVSCVDCFRENIAANEDEQVEEVVVKEESVNEMDPVEKRSE